MIRMAKKSKAPLDPDLRKPKKSSKTQKSKPKRFLIILCVLILLAGAGAAVYFLYLRERVNPDHGSKDPGSVDYPSAQIYSNFTGLEITNAGLNSSPTFCVQIPNGSTDGARPQIGLSQAGVVFEAIAESGITRFAAIFQNPASPVIGPIRSLRPYYLDWDTPFDCTVVHAGGSDEALAAIRQGGQRNLDEDYAYMWRLQNSGRLWNNLFTDLDRLLQFNTDHGYTSSSPKTFPRLTPAEAAQIAADHAALRDNPCLSDSEVEGLDCSNVDDSSLADTVYVNFGGWADYNTFYSYNSAENRYYRSYATGAPHFTYDCPTPASAATPEASCQSVQIAPSAIVALRVQESTMADHYHEAITTLGSGRAYIFQNGSVTEATWNKPSQKDQLTFKNATDETIAFTPGQVWIAAVPQFGSVSWE